MYAELSITLKKTISRSDALSELTSLIGSNSISVDVAVQNTPLTAVAAQALCAEQIVNRAVIVYFMAGNDLLVANIFAKSLSQLRGQCDRVARQISAQKMNIKDVRARIVVENDIDVSAGEQISFVKRLWQTLKDRFIGKFLPAFVSCGLTVQLMAGTTAVTSAKIGLAAAVLGAFGDAFLALSTVEKWKWKDMQ